MDLALTINAWIDEEVIFAQQLGSRQVFALVEDALEGAPGWDAQSLAHLANRVEKAGLVLAGLYVTRGAQAEDSMAWTARLIQEAGAAKIGLLSLSAGLFTSQRTAEKSIPAQLAALGEAAAQAGVKLAIPVALLAGDHAGGRARKTALTVESALLNLPPSTGLDASPALLLDWLEHSALGSAARVAILDRLSLVSYENEKRPGEKLTGAGVDELLTVCWRLRQAGFPGLIRLGRPAQWKGDTREGYHARAFTTGYLRAALQALQSANTPAG
jgi:hypothetical protein